MPFFEVIVIDHDNDNRDNDNSDNDNDDVYFGGLTSS
jgi:hypothetical protein